MQDPFDLSLFELRLFQVLASFTELNRGQVAVVVHIILGKVLIKTLAAKLALDSANHKFKSFVPPSVLYCLTDCLSLFVRNRQISRCRATFKLVDIEAQ